MAIVGGRKICGQQFTSAQFSTSKSMQYKLKLVVVFVVLLVLLVLLVFLVVNKYGERCSCVFTTNS